MPDNRRKLIWIMILTSLAVAGFVVYVLISLPALPKSAKQEFPVAAKIFNENKSSGNSYSTREDFITPAIEAFGEAISSTFNQNNSVSQNSSESSQSAPSIFQNPSTSPQSATVTEQEIFTFGYTEDYKSVLREINQGMIDIGFLKSNEIYKLDTMADTIALQDKYADYLEYLMIGIEGDGLTKDDIDKYRVSYRVILPKLWKEELIAVKSISKNSSIFEKIYFTYRQKTAYQKASSKLSLSQIREIFIKTAEAAYSINPCYREGAPNLIRGSQRSAPCCNCGITGSRCRTFVNDCGNGGCRCVNLGCLNRACPGLPAIWDPQTGICGCYEGGGGTTSPTPTPTPSPTATPTPTATPSPTPTGLKCSADNISAQTQALVNCVMSGAAAQGLSVIQPQPNQLNKGSHTCDLSIPSISCHYGGTRCNGTGNAADFSLQGIRGDPSRSAQNWDKLRNLATSCGATGAFCEAGSIRFIGTCNVVDIDHVHANASPSCGCN